MPEKVIVTQYDDFTVDVQATEETSESDHFHPVDAITDLSPFGMLLASLGTCTTILLHSYSQRQSLPLEEVTLQMEYVEDDGGKIEKIDASVKLEGDLDDNQHSKLQQIARQCAIHRLLDKGIHADMHPAE